MRQHKIPRLNGTQATLLGFLAVILLGSGLLALPVSAADGHAVPYMDALFTATTSVCVTGLVTVPTFSTWSGFGQAVIFLLIQIGGLGIGHPVRRTDHPAPPHRPGRAHADSGCVQPEHPVRHGAVCQKRHSGHLRRGGCGRAVIHAGVCAAVWRARRVDGPCSTPYRPSAMPGWM